MKKFFSKILIATFVLSFFLAPVTPNIDTYNKISVEKKIVKAENGWVFSVDGQIKGPYGETECSIKRTPYTIGITPNPTLTPCIDTGKDLNAEDITAAQTQLDALNDVHEYGCSAGPWTWHLCMLSWIYELIFVPVAFFARLAAQILDFFIYYSISSGSYASSFIEKGWGIMRDIANVFFIIALIYVAVKTILDLSTSNNKRMIGMIIVVALLINFSLFATKVVIDASNILARVFYANIQSVDKNGVVKPAEDDGEKSITVGLVKQFNPHTIFGTNTGSDISKNAGTFAAVLFLSILMMGYMIFMFLSVTLLFVSRVVMLWILMIMSPIAFISMTMPGVKIPSFNFSEWWKQLSDNAFLAPIFIFFLYLIITFGDIVKVVTGVDPNSLAPVGGSNIAVPDDSTFARYMDVVIPFILIFILLSTAKKIAMKMSGEMGSMINKAGAVVGGFAGGAALGGAALLATKTIGSGSALMNSKFGERLRDIGTRKEIDKDTGEERIVKNTGLGAYFARQGLKTFDKGTKASFDVRKTALGSQVSKFTGLNFQSASGIGLGSKEGGFAGSNERKAKEIEKEKELYKTNMSDKETREYTLTRSLNYEKEKAEAIQKAVGNKTGQDKIDAEAGALLKFIALKGEAPKVHNKTDDLNKERMLAFKDSIGKTGLLSSVSTSLVSAAKGEISQVNYKDGGNGTAYREALRRKKKKEAREKAILEGKVWTEKEEKAWDEDNKDLSKLDISKYDAVLGKEINERRSQRVKMGIGVTAAALGGGFAGAAVLGGAGSMATAVGAQFAGASVLGGGLASGVVAGGTALAGVGGNQYGSTLAENKVRESMEKESKALSKVADRLNQLNSTLNKAKEETTKTVKSSIIGVPDTIIKAPRLDIFTDASKNLIDKDKLRAAIADNDVEQLAERNILLKEDKNGSHAGAKLKLKELIQNKELLSSMKTIEKEIEDITGKKPGGENNSPAPAAAPSTPPTTP